MSMSDAINDLAAALAKAQAQLRPAIKDATNPHLKSKYADLRAIWEACRDTLAANGLSIVQLPSDTEEPGRVALTTVLLHTSGQYISSTFSTRLAQENAQGVGSALTYLRRYGLSSMVGIVADEDDDGHSASQAKQPTQRQPVEPPANGKKRPPTRDEIISRLTATFDEAIGLGIAIEDTTTDDKTDQQLIAAGQKLRALIDAAKRKAAMHEEADIPL